MVPTVAWEDGAVVMIDQRRLPGEDGLPPLPRPARGRGGHQGHGHPGRPRHRRRRRPRPRRGRAREPQRKATPCARSSSEMCAALAATPADRGQPLLGHRADAPALRGARGGGRGAAALGHCSRRRAAILDEDVASCRRIGDLGAELLPEGVAPAHPLQRGRPRHRRLRHGARRRALRRAPGQAEARLRRRDPAVAAGRAPHRLGAAAGRHPHHRSSPTTWPGTSWPGARSTRSWSAPTASPPTATSRTRSAPTPWPCSRRSTASPFYVAAPVSTFDLATPTGAGHPDRGARGRGGDARRGAAGGAGGRLGAQPRLRRDPAPLRDRDRVRARASRGRPTPRACASWPAPAHEPGRARPRDRDLLRRDRGRGRRGRPAHPLERGVEPGRRPRALRRGRARARLAPPRREHRAR